ncbi:monooxygenase family protein [Serinicoccus profundi]|uniref:monooxygenase family protein n=1 Tax=Serinicoccus profundi TaxID=1078471 RepID=UPI000255E25A|nr:DUF4188 domain-containing protein [Serinicoccus profundi]
MELAGAVFVGATRYASPAAWLRLAPRWRAMVDQMKRMPGYVHHQVYYDPPFTLGTVGYFATREDLLRFARSGVHRELMQWVTDGTNNATGGYIRVYEQASGRHTPGGDDAHS